MTLFNQRHLTPQSFTGEIWTQSGVNREIIVSPPTSIQTISGEYWQQIFSSCSNNIGQTNASGCQYSAQFKQYWARPIFFQYSENFQKPKTRSKGPFEKLQFNKNSVKIQNPPIFVSVLHNALGAHFPFIDIDLSTPRDVNFLLLKLFLFHLLSKRKRRVDSW